MSIHARLRASVVRRPDPVKHASPHRPFALSIEDYVIVRGHPAVFDQLVKAETLVSATGAMLTTTTGVQDVETGAALRFSGETNVNADWLPFRDDTWNSPRLISGAPLYVEEVSWIRNRHVCRFPAVFSSDSIELSTPIDMGTGSMCIVMAVSPGPEPAVIAFDNIVVTVQDGSVNVDTPEYSTWREASTGSDITMLGFRFSQNSVEVYVKAGYQPVTKTRFPGNATGNMVINGPIGILTMDAWIDYAEIAPVMESLLTAISGGSV